MAISKTREMVGAVLRGVAVAVVVVTAFLLQRWLCRISGCEFSPYLIFCPIVMLVALAGGLWSGLLGTLFSVLMTGYFTYPPQGSWQVYSRIDQISLAAFCVMGVMLSVAAELYRRARRKAGAYDREMALRDVREELRSQNELLHLAAKDANIGIWQWNIKTGELIVDDAWRQLYGLEPGTAIDLEQWKKMLHPEDREAVMRTVEMELREHREERFEHRIVRTDGTVRWVSNLGHITCGDNGEIQFARGINADITVYKQREQELRQSREQLRVTLASIGDAVLSSDCQGNVTYLNPVAEWLCGWGSAEAVGQPVTEVFKIVNEVTGVAAEDIAAKVLQEDRALALSNHAALLARDGREIPIEDSAAPIRDAHGKVSGVVLVFHDVTERRRQRNFLEASETRYRLLVEHSPLAIYVDRDGSIEYANPAAVALFGAATQQELLGRNPLDFFHSSEYVRIRERISHLKAGECAPMREERIVRTDGALRHALVVATPFIDRKGMAIQVVLEDVTERRQLEAAMHHYQVMATNSRDALLLLDPPTGRILEANPAAEALYGYSRKELLALTIFDLRDSPAETLTRDQMNEAESRGLLFESVHRRKGGECFPVEVSSQGGQGGDTQYLVSAVRDIATRKKAEQAIMKNENLISIGRMAGTVAHAFNNQLQVISGSAAAIAGLHAEDSLLVERAHQIALAGERAAQLTRQLLTFGRRSVSAPKTLSLTEVLLGMEDLLQQLVGSEVKLRVHGDAGLVRADPGELGQLVFNLMLNACDAMPAGGQIDIEIQPRNLVSAQPMSSGELLAGRYMVLSVRDSGCGISGPVMERIFEPFFTTKELGKGTGLGLSTALQVVRQYGGQIDVHSTPGQGSFFEVYLPRHEETHPGTAAQELSGAKARERVVLLAEDEEMVRQLVLEQLESLDFHVIAAANGEEALTLASEDIQSIDLVVTDMVMPKMNGRELAQRLRLLRPEIRVLMISGYTNCPLTGDELQEQHLHFLGKPFTRAALASMIEEILAEDEAIGVNP
jgi:PAS domain S-box-containing protein